LLFTQCHRKRRFSASFAWQPPCCCARNRYSCEYPFHNAILCASVAMNGMNSNNCSVRSLFWWGNQALIISKWMHWCSRRFPAFPAWKPQSICAPKRLFLPFWRLKPSQKACYNSFHPFPLPYKVLLNRLPLLKFLLYVPFVV